MTLLTLFKDCLQMGLVALLAAVLCLSSFPSGATAQSRSAAGSLTGGTVISSTVPEAGDIFRLHDEIEQLLNSVTGCAGDNMFPDGSGGCRGSKAPLVDFSVKDQVKVQNPYPYQDLEPSKYSLKGKTVDDYVVVTPDPSAKNNCTMNWTDLKRKEQVLAHGESITAYKSGKVSDGSKCVSENRICDNGNLSGSFTYNRCTTENFEDCTMNWADLKRKEQEVAHGDSIMAFENHKVPASEKCNLQERICDDGNLSGNFLFKRCVSEQPESCKGGTQRWAVGGNSCAAYITDADHKVTRTATDKNQPSTGKADYKCNDGSWQEQSGSSCQTLNADSCDLNPLDPACAEDIGDIQCTQQVPPECSCGGGYVPKGGKCVASCLPCDGGGSGGSSLDGASGIIGGSINLNPSAGGVK